MADERKSISNPTADEIREAAKELNFNMDRNELDTYEGFMGGLTENVRFVDELDEQIVTPNFPRANVHRPNDDDNPYNAWFYKCNIKGKFRSLGIKSTNPVAVGDHVCFEIIC